MCYSGMFHFFLSLNKFLQSCGLKKFFKKLQFPGMLAREFLSFSQSYGVPSEEEGLRFGMSMS